MSINLNALDSMYSKFAGKFGTIDLVTDSIEMHQRPSPSADVAADMGPTGPHHMRTLSLDPKNLPMVFTMTELDEVMRTKEVMRYLTLAQREASEMSVNSDGLVVYKQSGRKLDNGIVYSEYVVSLDNKFYVNKGRFHSEIMSGGAVKCAGCISAKNGIITSIDNVSGHYRPTPERFFATMNTLTDRGFINDHTRLSTVNGPVEPAWRALKRRVTSM